MTRAEGFAHRRRAILLIGVLIAIVAVAASDTTHGAIQTLLEYVRAAIVRHPTAGKFLFLLLAAVSGALAFFSSAIVIPVAVYTWGRPLTFTLLWTGWMIGGMASYLIGRYPGRRLFKRILPERKMRHYEKAISAKTPFFVVLLFQIALQSEIPGYVLGAARYDFRRYLLALAICELPYAIGAIYLSESFIGRNYVLLVSLGAAAILVSFLAFRTFRKHLGGKHEA
jgi:uncharacterized membrane protein YdjX (TVP38/TMEM64 family)